MLILAAVAVVAVVVIVTLPGGSRPRGGVPAAAASTTTAPPTTAPPQTVTATTAPPTTAARPLTPPTTAPDPGSFPQTTTRPSAADPSFQAHIRDLWQAVVDGRPAQGLPFFFPLGAYVQVKAISDPVHDYWTRLIANYEQDVMTLHARLGPAAASARLTAVSVPGAATWIVPGVEYNKGSYWRVYGTRVSYVAGGIPGSFEVTSMISWRGEWYVVHLGEIR
jgi:hypothetical protein